MQNKQSRDTCSSLSAWQNLSILARVWGSTLILSCGSGSGCHHFKVIWQCRVELRFVNLFIQEFYLYLFPSEKTFLTLERREGREKRGKNIGVGEKHQFLLHTPQLGTKPATHVCALTWNRTCNLLVCRMMPNQLSHTGQCCLYAFSPSREIFTCVQRLQHKNIICITFNNSEKWEITWPNSLVKEEKKTIVISSYTRKLYSSLYEWARATCINVAQS